MNYKPEKRIYKKLLQKNIEFKHVCEVGVYKPQTSNIIDFIKNNVKATLVEADPGIAEEIKAYFNNYNIQLHSCAIWDHKGHISLSKAEASTFVSDLPFSPATINDSYTKKEVNTIDVPCCPFSDIDDGTIDLLSIDIEGSEWFVLKHLRSTPKIISIETHGKYYTNPYLSEITTWVEKNNYVLWYKDQSDSVFVRKDIFLPAFCDKMISFGSDMKIGWKKVKRVFKKMLGIR